MNVHSLPAQKVNLREVVQEYEAKLNGGQVTREAAGGTVEVVAEYPGLDAWIEEHKKLHTNLDMASTIGGTYVGRNTDYVPSLSKRTMAQNLLKSAWKHVYLGLNINLIATAKDRKAFDMELEDPPEFTMENIGAVFRDYVAQPRFHILRGVAECFVDLDPAYKSHSKVRIGVKGLPKRIILPSCAETYSYGFDRLRDVINALRTYQGRPKLDGTDLYDWFQVSKGVRDFNESYGYSQGNLAKRGDDVLKSITYIKPGPFNEEQWVKWRNPEPELDLRIFGNGNAHLHFSKQTLKEINMALAEFYGEVLPDAEEENPEKRKSTAVAKDLQYYPTPNKVINAIINREIDFRRDEDVRMLEPSCGCGRILDVFAEKFPHVRTMGVEVDPGRAEQTRMKGHKVLQANFLEVVPKPQFDLLFMNPPFYGTHWRKHLDHAFKFLRQDPEGKTWRDGKVICILPATAYYDGHLDDLKGEWRDLPVASFAESGTNVPTGYFVTFGVKK